MKTLVKEIAIVIVLGLAVYFGVHAAIQQSIVQQISMQPTLEEGQRIFINKLDKNPDRGDIVIFIDPQNQTGIPLVKRVIGLPGETISVAGGIVYIDGVPLEEAYIADPPGYTVAATTVPENEFFVLGDNRNRSRDSHLGWTVPSGDIIGQAWLSIWPLDQLGFIPHQAYASR